MNRIVNEHDCTKTHSDCKNHSDSTNPEVTPTLTAEKFGNETRETKVFKAEKQVHTYTEIPLEIEQLLDGYQNVVSFVADEPVIVTVRPHATTQVYKDVKFEIEVPTAAVCIEVARALTSSKATVCTHVLPNTSMHDSATIERSQAAMKRLGTLIVGENCHMTARNKNKLEVTSTGVTDEHCHGNREKNKEKCESYKLGNDRARNKYAPTGKKIAAIKRLDALINEK